MIEGEPRTVRLSDYSAPVMQIRKTRLTFDIQPGVTTVESRLTIARTQDDGAATLELDGQELELVSVALDGETLSENAYQVNDDSLTLYNLPDECELVILNRIHPETNTALEGLYKSGSMYCTQCEAEGFRKITYYQDRPDVLATFVTTIIADPSYPVLLSNGNPVHDETLADGRRRVTWEDPFPKPSYLFALVAGDLACLTDQFQTMSGRAVELRIYSEPHNIEQCHYAMDVLKRSMRWDEEAYGREYDLDIFMIVAVEDFNMGAMENKGLNIFNTSCVLATPDTATDLAYQRVEGVVAHEYFHNWSGNRVTCRDWFQLSLKEGFTVFRDAEFSSDMNSRTVKRIEDVSFLRSVQFAEDAGPLAHPIRPDSYIEISNFYTPTVYEKGAEVIRMLHTIVGPDDFRKGSDLYFERHDGQAATTDDFLAAMADASGKDLGRFERWYHQAGTPVVNVTSSFHAGTLRLEIEQSAPVNQAQADALPLHIPFALGLIADDGSPLVGAALDVTCAAGFEIRGDSLVIDMVEAVTVLEVHGLLAQPQISVVRGFSAPVRVNFDRPQASLAFLATHDSDGFASWDALQTLLVQEVSALAARTEVADVVFDLFARLLEQANTASTVGQPEERFMLAAKLAVPEEGYLFEQFEQVDVEAVCGARERLQAALGQRFSAHWQALYAANAPAGPYTPDADGMSRRALRNLALSYLAPALDAPVLADLLEAHFSAADNLTDRRAALAVAVNAPALDAAFRRDLLERFYQRWQAQALVVNQWLSLQAGSDLSNAATIRQLAEHPAFDRLNPNKVRAVYSAFANLNLRNFHAADGTGYELIGDAVLELNASNPQMASALAKPLTRWRRIAGERQRIMQNVLQRIAASDNLSPDVYEVVAKSLPAASA